jgi:dynein light intermediate chain 1
MNPDGASLIYTTANELSDLPTLIHTSLDIESSRGRWEPPKASVIERDKILVPPNWDSAGKIRVLRDGSDMELEEVSHKWSEDIHRGLVANQSISPPPMSPTDDGDESFDDSGLHPHGHSSRTTPNSAVGMYEDKVPYAGAAYSRDQGRAGGQLEVADTDIQEFLRGQLKILDGYRSRAENKPIIRVETDGDDGRGGGTLKNQDLGVSHHIGPVKCNIGGIQVDIDADDAVRRLQVRDGETGAHMSQILTLTLMCFRNSRNSEGARTRRRRSEASPCRRRGWTRRRRPRCRCSLPICSTRAARRRDSKAVGIWNAGHVMIMI